MNSAALSQLLFIAAIIAAFWFLILRPQQQQRKKHDEMVAALKPGVQVITIGGFYATVKTVEDDSLTVEIADGVEARIARQAVGRIVGDDELAADDVERETDTDHSTHDDPMLEGAENEVPSAPEPPAAGEDPGSAEETKA